MAPLGGRYSMESPRGARRLRACLGVSVVAWGLWSAPVASQPPTDLRAAHQLALRSTVVVSSPIGEGAGWVTELDGVRVVITNRHVVQQIHRVDVIYADGVEATGLVVHRSTTLDVAVVVPAQDVHVPPLPMAHRPLVRGERVVLAGHPGGMRFITSEGVVAGAAHGLPETDRACGENANCTVIDAETHFGNSGGPVVDAHGNCVGMVWGGMTATSFTLAVHAEPMFRELSAVAERIHAYRQRLRGHARHPRTR